MARPGHPSPEVRACDADRDRVVAELRERFADGSLAQESFVFRVDAALRARRHGDLAEVLADCPVPGSTNGTRLNGWRITDPVPVQAGDQVTFGAMTLVVADHARRAGVAITP